MGRRGLRRRGRGHGASLTTAYDATLGRLVVGQPVANLVTLLTLPTVLVFADGFE